MYSVSETSTTLIDHEHLSHLIQYMNDATANIALVGFNEYTKHLLNMFPDRVSYVFDPNPSKIGITWRGIKVKGVSFESNVSTILITDYKYLYETQGLIDNLYSGRIPIKYPPRMHYVSTDYIDVKRQQGFYRPILQGTDESPPSMMTEQKIMFLVELVRLALQRDGDLIEMGVYQGGSAWYIAKTLLALGHSRDLVLYDVFEQHMMHPNATMCNDEISRWFSIYDKTIFIEGMVSDPEKLQLVQQRRFCFAHYDIGWDDKALPALWDALVPGAVLLLDNYGHLAAQTWKFDKFIESKGEVVVRFPWSEQGLVIKR